MDIDNFKPNHSIDWELIWFVNNYLERCKKYTHIEVPWIVPKFYSRLTHNNLEDIFRFDDEHDFIGSAEQSFIYYMMNDRITKNKNYIASTPCFRNNTVDKIHSKVFIKSELFTWSDEPKTFNMMSDVIDIITSYCDVDINYVTTDEGYDLEVNGIEIGSYGVRNYGQYTWTYGTAIAEPRFSLALKG